jgi:tRNA threonylcarbamoyladenosine biosynthesis protein TsaE
VGGVGLIAIGSLISRSPEETFQYGYELGKVLKQGSLLLFYGDLAAGKTTFIKGVAAAAAGVNPIEVNSPTFVLLNCYEGATPVYHFDLYRLHGPEEFIGLGFDEYFDRGGICCIEWSERIEPMVSSRAIKVKISCTGPETREIHLEWKS